MLFSEPVLTALTMRAGTLHSCGIRTCTPSPRIASWIHSSSTREDASRCFPGYHLLSFSSADRLSVQVKAMVDANQVALGHLLLSFAAVYEAGPEDLPSESETLWLFVEFIADELQRAEARGPALLLGMLQLLDTLARTEPDEVWAHLHSRGGMVMVGDMVAGAMLEYRNLCAGDETQQQQRMFGSQAVVRDVHLPADGINAMVAYLRVLQHIADAGAFTQARVQALQSKMNQPLLHFWFTMLDLPVPPVLKAALFDLLGAFAADLVAALHMWALLEASAVIQKVPASEAFAAAPLRMDISFQWNEVESREETYPETLAFIKLMTKLLALCGPTRSGPATDAGAAAAHVLHFVRDTVFLGLDRRSYRDSGEKWRLASACHAYFRCHLEVTQICCTQLRDGNVAARGPGAELLLDFNNEGPVMRRVVGAFAGGADRLEQDRFLAQSPDMAECILEGLKLLIAAFDLDAVATPTPGTAQQLARLDVLLLRDKRRTADLLSYVRCAEQPSVRTAAVQLLHAMASRNDRIVVALEPHIAARLKEDVADAMERGLADAYSVGSEEVLSSASVAHTIQQLLLTSLRQNAVPGLAHLLLGFELPADASILTLEPLDTRSSMSVLLQAALLPPETSDWTPALVAQEHTYHVLCTLASDRRTAAATVERVRSTLPLAAVLEMAAQPFEQSSSAARTATQNWRAWVLRLVALTMFRRGNATAAGIVYSDAGILRTLFKATTPSAVQLLHASQWRVDAAELPPALTNDLEQLGIRMPGSGGDELYDVAAWDAALRQRIEQRGLPPNPEFVGAVLQHLVRVNDMRLEDAAARGLLGAWSELLVLIFCQRADALHASLQDAPETVVLDLLFTCLKLLPSADVTRVALLLRVVRAALEYIRANAASMQPLGALPLPPSSCHDVLRALLGVCMRSDRCEATRHYACASLLSLARMCRPPQWNLALIVPLDANPSLESASWAENGTSMRRELDAGVVAELRRLGGPLLAVLVRDALGAAEHGRVQSLVVLEALLGLTDGAATALEAPLLLSGLPAAVATAVERTPRSVLTLPPRACEEALSGMRAQVSFLMSVARYAPAGATHLVGCGVVLRLAACPVLDGMPEECTLPGNFVSTAALLPALQLVGELLHLLPDSADAFDQARRFVLAHQEAILRVMVARDASSDQTVALAAVRLLTMLCSHDTGAELSRFREALERICWHVFDASAAVSAPLVMQAVLLVYIRRLVVAKRTILSLSGYRTTPAAARLGPPTLQTIMSMMKRHVAALGDLLRTRFELLGRVSEIPNSGAGTVEQSMMVLDGNVAIDRRPRSKANAAMDFVQVDADVGTLLQALENALEAMHATLATELISAAKMQPLDVEALRYDLLPVLDELARLQSEDCGRDVGFLRLVQRRLGQLMDTP